MMSKTNPVAVGLIGCGNISSIYLQNAQTLDPIEIVACADMRREAAEAQAAKFGVGRVCSVEELLADPKIEIILNLTTPESHGTIALAALEAGKSVYNEKPLAMMPFAAQRSRPKARARSATARCGFYVRRYRPLLHHFMYALSNSILKLCRLRIPVSLAAGHDRPNGARCFIS